MKSIDERLSDSNPVVGGYVPADYEQMLRRVMGQPRRVDAAWARFRWRMAGSVAAASALTLLGVSALNGVGAALPVLGISAMASPHPTGAATPRGPAGGDALMLRLPTNYRFSGAENFSTAVVSAPVFNLVAPSDPAAALTKVATVLGAPGTVTPAGPSTNPRVTYALHGTTYIGSLTANGGTDYWNVTEMNDAVAGVSGATGTVLAPTTSPTPAPAAGVTGASGVSGVSGSAGATGPTGSVAATGAMIDTARNFVQSLGGYVAGSITNTVSGATTSVTVPLIVNGYPSDLSDTFTFNADGTLQSASGDLFTLSVVATYPLISESAGVDQIVAQEDLLRRLVTFGAATPTSTPSSTTPTPQNGVIIAPAGSTGPTGPTGTTGASGVTSTVPVSGSTGPTGPTEPTGTTGASGASGVTSTAPISGSTGPTGPTGTTGASGVTTTIPVETVNLTAVTMRYASYQMRGGVWMELPVYDYAGTVVTGDYQVDFTVVPLPSQYLTFAPVVLPLGAR